MAKSIRNLWPQFCSWDNLLLAYQRCRRGKRYSSEASAFDWAWQPNLVALRRDLMDGSYQPGGYRHFRILEPKPRKISAAPFRDRIVHHAIVQVLEPHYERRFIHDSYACRRGKGTQAAWHRAQEYVRRFRYALKTDIVRFFPNVDHEVLIGLLERTIADPPLNDLIRSIIASGDGVLTEEATQDFFPGDDLFARLRPKGLPIGNLTSQFFANVLLDQIDHTVKDEWAVPGYVRYADDLVLFSNDKAFLWTCRQQLQERLNTLRLKLHPDKTAVLQTKDGLTFLGFVIRPHDVHLQQGVIQRFNRRRKRQQWLFRNGQIQLRQVRESLRAWNAYVSQANSFGIRRALMKRMRFGRRPTTSALPPVS